MARGLAGVPGVDLTVVVNVGDDEEIHGLHVSPDIDTVIYTMAGSEGGEGWGRAGDSFAFNDELARFGVDNTFRLGDRDLALNLFRTNLLHDGTPLSAVTEEIAKSFGVTARVIPATDDRLRTRVRVADGDWIAFQEYFVIRGSRDEVQALSFEGAETASAAPGVLEAIVDADLILIAPSNPPLSIWPILSVGEIKGAVSRHARVMAVSPLFGGKALKGPADRVMASLGLAGGNAGVVEAYDGIIDTLVIDVQDAADAAALSGIDLIVTDTRIEGADQGKRLAQDILGQ